MAIAPTAYVSESLATYPPLLNRYLVAKLLNGINTAVKLETAAPRKRSCSWEATAELLHDRVPGSSSSTEPSNKRVHVNHSEAVTWTKRLRGHVGPADKQAADDLAIGSMKDTAALVARLSYSQQFGAKLGGALKALLGSLMA